jgi:hypothetical protein
LAGFDTASEIEQRHESQLSREDEGGPGCSASASVFEETWFSLHCPSARERSVICVAAAVVPCPPRAHGRQQSRSEKAQSGRCSIVCPTSSLTAPTATAHRGQLRAQDDDRGGRVAQVQVQFMQRCKHDKCFTHTTDRIFFVIKVSLSAATRSSESVGCDDSIE